MGIYLAQFIVVFVVPFTYEISEYNWQTDTNLKNKVFSNPLFAKSSSSLLSCAVECIESNTACTLVTYTTSTEICRGHTAIKTNFSDYDVTGLTISWKHDHGDDETIKTKTCEPYTLATGAKLCYDIKQRLQTYGKAEDHCKAEGGHLITLDTAQKLEAVVLPHSYDPKTAPSYWIGLNDKRVEGTWVWSNGNTLSFNNWARDDTQDSTFITKTEMDCVYMSPSRQWYGHMCEGEFFYICEKVI